ncbi:MAG: S8 family serine peptidase [Candidatus Krumholzibacteria bacterium]|nr:S8 family serine peptidase [Candidatus Krumholzibacteria bacterium]
MTMRTTLTRTILLPAAAGLLAASGHAGPGAAGAKIAPALARALAARAPGEPVRVWVFFDGRGEDIGGRLQAAEASLTPKARARRLRCRGEGKLVDGRDLPVLPAYVTSLARTGAHVRHTSRWLNAVSVETDAAGVEALVGLPFVARLDVVRSHRAPLPEIVPAPVRPRSSPPSGVAPPLDYGASAAQLEQIQIPDLHALGYYGNGVWIAVLDAGFNRPDHESFASLRIHAQWDFVNGDSVVADESGQMGTGDHGTVVLSTLAGYKPGTLIGPAWDATYLLAKTENTDWERHQEEDDWIAGAEWADSIGADIISTSLGYRSGFTNGEPSYTSEDMDGNTAIVTIGADVAASRGILVVASAGNGGAAVAPQNTINAPADGDSVLAVGAVDATGVRWGGSSMGPTWDGRFKPDVMARGLATYCASPTGTNVYTYASGTSLACPLAAGAAALVLESNPTLSNIELRDRLRDTADRSMSPDNAYGWGIVAAADAAGVPSSGGGDTPVAGGAILYPAAPNPFNPTTTIRFELPSRMSVRLSIHDLRGRQVRLLAEGTFDAGEYPRDWDGRDASGRRVASGVYFCRLDASGDIQGQKLTLVE